MTSVYPLAVNTALPLLQTAMIRPLNRGVHPFPSFAGEGGRRSRTDGVWPAASTVSRIARPLPQAFDDLIPAFRTPSGPPGHLPRFAEKGALD